MGETNVRNSREGQVKRLALLSCRSPFLDDSKIYAPMASLYLKSWVEEKTDTEVFLADDDYDLDQPERFDDFDAVGISIMTPQREEAHKIAESLKAHNPDRIVIAGGPHVKHYKEEVAANPNFDFVVPLDGEKSLVEIVQGETTDRILTSVMSKKDIETAPRPDRTSPNARKVLSQYHYKLNGRPSTTMMSARGCPMACTFCEDARTAAKWTGIESLEAQMDDIVRLGYGGVYLFDDLFAIAMPKVEPIAKALKERDLIYRCNGQANFFTKWGEDFAKLLGETGCVEIAFGHESGSQTILDNVQKRTSVEQNYQSVQYAKKHGLRVKSFLMLGLPGENDETIAATERFIQTAGMDDFQLAVYYPYKGTQIRDAIDRGEAGFDLTFEGEGLGAYGQSGGSSESVVRTARYTSTELLSIRDELVRKYKPQSHAQKWEEDKFFEQGKDI